MKGQPLDVRRPKALRRHGVPEHRPLEGSARRRRTAPRSPSAPSPSSLIVSHKTLAPVQRLTRPRRGGAGG